MQFNLISQDGRQLHPAHIERAIIAGWTGRDREAMEKHIVELQALGVPRPAATPMYYRVAAARLTTENLIEVSGTDSSGEVEFVLLKLDGRLWIGVGSDHTDRKLETIGVAISKQLCEKPMGADIWPLDEVLGHWDRLVLRSYIVENGQRTLYQEGPVTTMLDPQDLLNGWESAEGKLPDNSVMFCGTLAALGGIRFSEQFAFELEDPVLQRSLRHEYRVVALPIAG